jgi:hypothetical protein
LQPNDQLNIFLQRSTIAIHQSQTTHKTITNTIYEVAKFTTLQQLDKGDALISILQNHQKSISETQLTFSGTSKNYVLIF